MSQAKKGSRWKHPTTVTIVSLFLYVAAERLLAGLGVGSFHELVTSPQGYVPWVVGTILVAFTVEKKRITGKFGAGGVEVDIQGDQGE